MIDTPELIAAIKADREAGTPGPWMLDISQSKYLSRENKHCHLISGPGWAYFARIWVRLMDTDENTPVGEANARRIARVPDMEAAIIAQAAEIERLHARVAEDYFGSLVAKARVAATKASVKFPQPNYVTLKIAEEAGEVIRGAVHYAEGRMDWSEVEGEIVQLLAMLIRFVIEGDQINGITPPRNIGEAP